jgi:hypothetical protein
MPRLTRSNPSYRKRKASGQAVVTTNGRDVYVGPLDSKVSRDEYDRVIGECSRTGGSGQPQRTPASWPSWR